MSSMAIFFIECVCCWLSFYHYRRGEGPECAAYYAATLVCLAILASRV